MSLKVLVKGDTNAVPTSFSLDLSALIIASAPQFDHQGPFLAMFSCELAFQDTTGAGGGFDFHLIWRSLAGQIRSLDTATMGFGNITTAFAALSAYMTRKGPGELFTFDCSMSNPGDALFNWQLSLVPLCFPDAIGI